MAYIYPSLMSANPLEIGAIIDQLAPYAAGFHLDLMDNHFVPNLQGGIPLINAVAQATSLPLSIHLMIDHPTTLIRQIKLTNPKSRISFHTECKDPIATIIDEIAAIDALASIAISPHTALSSLKKLLPTSVNHVLLMLVQPGFSGQPMLADATDRLKELIQYKNTHHPNLTIAVDGGITLENSDQLLHEGAQELMIGNGIFGTKNIVETIKLFSKK